MAKDKINGIKKPEPEIVHADMIADRFRHIVADHLGVKLAQVKDEASFMKDLGADSLDGVELVMAAEDEFNIEIPDADAEKLKDTVGGAIAYIKGRGDAK